MIARFPQASSMLGSGAAEVSEKKKLRPESETSVFENRSLKAATSVDYMTPLALYCACVMALGSLRILSRIL